MGPYFLSLLHEHNFSAIFKPPLCITELDGAAGKQLLDLLEEPFGFLEKAASTAKSESAITYKQLQPFHPIPESCSVLAWDGIVTSGGTRMGNVPWE